ncbi:MAG: CinA family protein [Actinomycetota bacterium]
MSDFDTAQHIVEILRSRNLTVSVAESLTGGGVGATITAVAGASDVFVGGVTAYQKRIKISLLGISPDLIEEKGVVSEEIAIAMAEGVKSSLHTIWAISTTGVAGPGASDGVPAGTVWIAIAGPGRRTLQLNLLGTREEVRNASVSRALAAFERILLSTYAND